MSTAERVIAVVRDLSIILAVWAAFALGGLMVKGAYDATPSGGRAPGLLRRAERRPLDPGGVPVMRKFLLAVALVVAGLTLSACPAGDAGKGTSCDSTHRHGAQRFNDSNDVWQVCQDGKWINTPNPNGTVPGGDEQ